MTAPSFNIGDDVTVNTPRSNYNGDGGPIHAFNPDGTVRVDLFYDGGIRTFHPTDLVRTIHATNTPVAHYDGNPVFVCGVPSDVEETVMRDRMAREMRAALRAIGIHITLADATSRIDVLVSKRGWTA